MTKKNKGSHPCDACDRSFSSITHLQQHLRDKHKRHSPPKQAPSAPAPPPVQEPQVRKQNEPVHNPPVFFEETPLCEHCLVPFKTLNALKQHKIRFHSWKCTRCPALPPFEDGTAWQMHFNEVHAAVGAQPSKTTDTKGKEVATPTNEEKISGQRGDANTKNVVTQPEPSPSPNVDPPIISSPLPVASTSGVNLDEIASSPSDDKPGFLTPKAESQPIHHTTPNLEGQTASFDERDLLSSNGPTLSLLVEIDPGARRGRDETTYEIASDVWSPTMTVSSIGADEPEEDYDVDVFPSPSLGLRKGSSPQKGQHITDPPRVPKFGGRESPTLSDIVTGNHSRDEPNVQTQNGLDGATPSPTNLERYQEVRSDSPTSTTFSSRDAGRDTYQGNLSRDDDPLRTHRSKGSERGSPKIHFECRICLSDPTPTSNLTATLCGHLFCYECIATEVLGASRCPVCKNVLALYCLFKLDLAS